MSEFKQAELGGFRREYKINTAPGGMAALGLMMIYGAVGTLILILGLLEIVELGSAGFGLTGVAPIALGVGLWGAFNFWRQRDNSLKTYQHGFTLRQKGRNYTFRWSEIKFVWAQLTLHKVNGVPVKTVHEYFVQADDSARVKLDNIFEDIELIGETILRETFPHLYQKALESCERGEEVDFGGLKINRTGLSLGDKSVGWNEIEKIETRDGTIRIRKQGKWLNFLEFDAGSMPNLNVFEALANKILSESKN